MFYDERGSNAFNKVVSVKSNNKHKKLNHEVLASVKNVKRIIPHHRKL